jgi:hypothetical protein
MYVKNRKFREEGSVRLDPAADHLAATVVADRRQLAVVTRLGGGA